MKVQVATSHLLDVLRFREGYDLQVILCKWDEKDISNRYW